MSKRFTDTMKWRDAWFRKLSPETKLFWIYILDNCDIAGFWKVDIELAEFCIGKKIDIESTLTAINEGKERIAKKEPDRWQVINFIRFQYGELSEDSPAHRGVLKVLKGIGTDTLLKGYGKSTHTLKDKDKDKDKDKERGGVGGKFVKPKLDEVKTYCKERRNSVDPETFLNFYESKGWVVGKAPMRDWRACVRTWERNRDGIGWKKSDDKVVGTAGHQPGKYDHLS